MPACGLQMAQEAMHEQTGVDLVTGMRSKLATVFGRPKWDEIFAGIKERHPEKRVGVFVCGPTVICGLHASETSRIISRCKD